MGSEKNINGPPRRIFGCTKLPNDVPHKKAVTSRAIVLRAGCLRLLHAQKRNFTTARHVRNHNEPPTYGSPWKNDAPARSQSISECWIKRPVHAQTRVPKSVKNKNGIPMVFQSRLRIALQLVSFSGENVMPESTKNKGM